MLLDKPLESHPIESNVELPPPSALKRKIIIKNKKKHHHHHKKGGNAAATAASPSSALSKSNPAASEWIHFVKSYKQNDEIFKSI